MVKRFGTLLFLLVGLLLAACGDVSISNNAGNNPTVPAPTSSPTTGVIATATALPATTQPSPLTTLPATTVASATTVLPAATSANHTNQATTLPRVTTTTPATRLAKPTPDISQITAVTAPIVSPTATSALNNTPGKRGKPVAQNGHILSVTTVERAKAFDGDKVELESHTVTSGHYEAYPGFEFVLVEVNLEAGSEVEVTSSRDSPIATLKDSQNGSSATLL